MRILVLAQLLLLLNACLNSGDTKVQNIDKIEFGYFSGSCVYGCNDTFAISKDSISYVSDPINSATINRIDFTEPTPLEVWDTINFLYNKNIFENLDSVYGCPDCADGGREWISILNQGNVSIVQFEARDTLFDIESLQNYGRQVKRQSLVNALCYYSEHKLFEDVRKNLNAKYFYHEKWDDYNETELLDLIINFLNAQNCIDQLERPKFDSTLNRYQFEVMYKFENESFSKIFNVEYKFNAMQFGIITDP